ARYYDPVVGRFLSADTTQGNAQGMDPYSYVGNNPETKNDPTGQRFCDPTGNNCGQPCGGNCSPDPEPSNPPVNCHGGGPRSCSSGGAPPSGGGCHPGINASAACNDWYVKHGLPAFKNRMDALDSSIRWKQIAGYTLMILADIVFLMATKNPIRWLQLIIDFGGTMGRLLLPALVRQFAGGGAVYEAILAFSAVMSRIIGVAEGLLGALRAGSLWAQWTIAAFMFSTLASLGPAQVTLRLVLYIAGPLIGGLLDAGANWLLASAQDDIVQETHEKNMDFIQWCAQYGNGACGTPP
ncbi:MAG: hypothetical protein H0U76_28440, partial [Ktedonobacteraceae bacterium]|nr:hypothetical protein [Ktedonobacteraceae bacterium]